MVEQITIKLSSDNHPIVRVEGMSDHKAIAVLSHIVANYLAGQYTEMTDEEAKEKGVLS